MLTQLYQYAFNTKSIPTTFKEKAKLTVLVLLGLHYVLLAWLLDQFLWVRTVPRDTPHKYNRYGLGITREDLPPIYPPIVVVNILVIIYEGVKWISV